MINLVRHRLLFFIFSLLLIVPGMISLISSGLRLGIDFAGGTLWELHLPTTAYAENAGIDRQIAEVFESNGLESPQVLLSPRGQAGSETAAALVRTKVLPIDAPERDAVIADLKARFTEASLDSYQSVSPTVSAASTRAAVLAVLGASVAIMIYLSLAFRKAPNPIRYGICALAAMLHDVVLVVGIASILGQVMGLEVDALFLTAVLTVISFSVHDTIVVFDRVRENVLHMAGVPFEEVVNHSVVQTLVRSINTQMTTLLTLTALLLFGGVSIRNFVLILLIGLVSGTYSSIFNAAQLLVVWETGRISGKDDRYTASAVPA